MGERVQYSTHHPNGVQDAEVVFAFYDADGRRDSEAQEFTGVVEVHGGDLNAAVTKAKEALVKEMQESLVR